MSELAEIVEEGGRVLVPGGPDGALVKADLRNLDEAPLAAVERRMIGLAEIGDTDQSPVGAIAPTMIGAGEDRGVAVVVAADLHAAVPAGIEKDMDLPGAVAAQQDRLFAHARDKKIARIGDLALMADKQPGAGKNLFLLLGVDLLVDKDLAADPAGVQIDHPRAISGHLIPPVTVKKLMFPQPPARN